MIWVNEGFVNLFNGLDYEGWMAGTGRFRINEDERALESEGGIGLLWYSKRDFVDFILKIDWRVNTKTIIQVYLLDFLIQAMILGLLLTKDMRFK